MGTMKEVIHFIEGIVFQRDRGLCRTGDRVKEDKVGRCDIVIGHIRSDR